jgi:hypothetical protein
MNKRNGESVETTLGFVLGVSAMVFGYGLFINGCNSVFPSPSSISSCRLAGSNFGGLSGIVLMLLGLIVVAASIAVLRGRNTQNTWVGVRGLSGTMLLVD